MNKKLALVLFLVFSMLFCLSIAYGTAGPDPADSDGDGYPDGLEIKTGHNPMGPGKIFETEESDVSSTTTTTTTSPTTTL